MARAARSPVSTAPFEIPEVLEAGVLTGEVHVALCYGTGPEQRRVLARLLARVGQPPFNHGFDHEHSVPGHQ
jgi:hypothetical protein